HLIDFAEHVEHALADVPRRHLAVEVLVYVGFDLADDPLDLLFADRSLVAGLLQPRADFPAVERDARAVLFDHLQRRLFDLLVGREPAPAFPIEALPATSNHKLVAGARVDDFRFSLTAEGAEHTGQKSRQSPPVSVQGGTCGTASTVTGAC